MIQIDVPIVFAIGAGFADAAQRQIRTGHPAEALRAQLQANLFAAIVFSWAPVYYMVAYFGWQTSHVWWHADSVTEYPLLLPGMLIAFTLAVNAGFLVGKWLVLRERQRTIYGLYLAVVVYSVGWLAAMGERVSRLGTYREFAAGRAPHWTDDSTFLLMLGLNVVVTGGALAVFLVRLLQEGSRLARSANSSLKG